MKKKRFGTENEEEGHSTLKYITEEEETRYRR